MALAVLGRLRARRGDSGQWTLLDKGLELAERTRELNRIVPVAAARAEAAWLEGRDAAALEETTLAWELVLAGPGDPWQIGELAQWRRRAGSDEELPKGIAKPFALALAGDWRGASALWAELGCPYEAALAAAEGDDVHSPTGPGCAPRARRRRDREDRRAPHAGARRTRASSGPAPADDREPGWVDREGGGGPLARGRRAAQRRDRGAPRRIGQDRRPPRLVDPAEARSAVTRPGGRGRSRARVDPPNIGDRPPKPR